MRSHPYLKRLYRQYNRKYFGGQLPNICVRFGNAQAMKQAGVPRGTLAATLLSNGKPYAIVIRDYANKSWRYIKADLLHELVHVAHPRADHGPVFENEMKRLANLGAFKGVW